MKSSEYVITDDTDGITDEIFGGTIEGANRRYFADITLALRDSSIESDITTFSSEEIDVSLSEMVRRRLEDDPYAICLILDRFLCKKMERDTSFTDRIKRLSIARNSEGKKISRVSKPSVDDQIGAVRDSVGDLEEGSVFLVDDGFFTGGTVEFVAQKLEQKGLPVSGAIGYIGSEQNKIFGIPLDIAKVIPELYDWIDARDFGVFGGRINKKSVSGRAASAVPYIAPWSDGKSASLDMRPDFFDISKRILKAQEDLLLAYQTEYGELTFRDFVRSDFPVPTNSEGTIPLTINTNVLDYVRDCNRLVDREKEREVVVLDMDGTLYDLIPDFDGEKGYGSSKLRKAVEANILKFIKDNIAGEDPVKLLQTGLANSIGTSAFLESSYGISRKDYFDSVWNINPEGLANKNQDLLELLKSIPRGTFGSDKKKFILLTSAPAVWARNVLGYLGVEDLFESIYTGEMYKTKDEIMKLLVGRYDAGRIISVGDQMDTDIIPATALGVQGRLVESASETARVLAELGYE